MIIFISHSSKDDRFVDNLRLDLHRRGYQTWVDHHDIPAGKVWDQVVEQQLKTCDLMILVLSSAATTSDEVGIEWREFRTMNKTILPVKVQDCPIPLLIRHLQHLDFSDEGAYERSLRRLLDTLPPPPTTVTKDLKLDTREMEMVRLKNQVMSLQLKIETLVGQNQVLFVFPDLGKTSVFDLEQEKVFIGWHDQQTGAIPGIDLTKFGAFDLGVSRQHAMVSRSGSGLYITDLNSNNGTFINHRRLPPDKPIPLLNEALIHLGQLAFQVFYRQDAVTG